MKSFKAFIVVLLVLCEACTKTGPAGPTGPQGSQGVQGMQGIQGPTGTANVMYSSWIDITTAMWPDLNAPSDHFDISAPEITDSIIQSGTVLVYVKDPTNRDPHNPVMVVKLANIFNVNGVFIEEQFGIAPGLLRLGIERLDQQVMGYFPEEQVRYVIIPASVKVAVKKSGDRNFANYLNKINYKDIKNYFHIPG